MRLLVKTKKVEEKAGASLPPVHELALKSAECLFVQKSELTVVGGTDKGIVPEEEISLSKESPVSEASHS